MLLVLHLVALILKILLEVYMYYMKTRIMKKIKKDTTWQYSSYKLVVNLAAIAFAALALSNYYIGSVCLLFKALVLLDGEKARKQINREDWGFVGLLVYWMVWNLVFYVLMADLRKNTLLG